MLLPFFARKTFVIAVVGLLIYAHGISNPLTLTNPPVTRRPNAYFIPSPQNPKCGTLVGSGNWTNEPVSIPKECEKALPYASCTLEAVRRWEWSSQAVECGAQYQTHKAAKALLAGKWVACVGDSIARNLCASILRSLGSPPTTFGRHADFEQTVKGEAGDAIVSFFWKPFPQNSTQLIAGWEKVAKPDVIVVAGTLWHTLHVRDAAAFAQSVQGLSEVAKKVVATPVKEQKAPMAVLAAGTEVYTPRMVSEAKRTHMTPAKVDEYNKALAGAGALAPGGPYGLLDMFSITYGCGIECTTDGVHSQPPVYDTAAQIVLNMYEQCQSRGKTCWAE